MKKFIIVALLVLNVGLLAGIVLSSNEPAYAQHAYLDTDYILITGQIANDWDAVYIIDLKREELASFRFDRTQKRLIPYRKRNLTTDFKGKGE